MNSLKNLSLGLIIIGSSLMVGSSEAQAHDACYRQQTPFGKKTICRPHVHTPRIMRPTRSQDSCLGGGSPGPNGCGNPNQTPSRPPRNSSLTEFTNIYVHNARNKPFTYYINGVKYRLEANYNRKHQVKVNMTNGEGSKNYRIVSAVSGKYCTVSGANKWWTLKITHNSSDKLECEKLSSKPRGR